MIDIYHVLLLCTIFLLGFLLYYFIKMTLKLSAERGRDNVTITEDDELLHPTTVKVQNKSDNDRVKAVLFGFNQFNRAVNYGSEKNVVVESNMNSLSYGEMLNQSAIYPMEVGFIRLFVNDEEVYDDLGLNVVCKDSLNGSMSFEDLRPSAVSKNTNDRFQKQLLDIPVEFTLDAGCYLELYLPKNAEVRISLFPKKRYSLRAMLRACRVNIPAIPRNLTD